LKIVNSWTDVLKAIQGHQDNDDWISAVDWLREWVSADCNKRRGGVLVAYETLTAAAESDRTTATAVTCVLSVARERGLAEETDARLRTDGTVEDVGYALDLQLNESPTEIANVQSDSSGDNRQQDGQIVSVYKPIRFKVTSRRPEKLLVPDPFAISTINLGAERHSPMMRLLRSNDSMQMQVQFDVKPDEKYLAKFQDSGWQWKEEKKVLVLALDEERQWQTQANAEKLFTQVANSIRSAAGMPFVQENEWR
jgi:hypothetical protein